MSTINLLFTLVVIAGYIANINSRKKTSYWLWLCSNLFWMSYNAINQESELAFVFFIYSLFCLWGIIKRR